MDFISAGDIEKYSYCPLSWWLSRVEKDTNEEGVKKHRELGEKINKLRGERRKIKTRESLVLYYSLAATLISLLGISLFYSSLFLGKFFISISILWIIIALYLLWKYEKGTFVERKTEKVMLLASSFSTIFSIFSVTFILPPNYLLGYLFEIASLLWLIFATYFLYLTLKSEITYNEINKELKLPDGEIIYVDDLEKAPVIKSKKYGIWGRPDLLIKIGEDYIPIEIKTGRIPRGPLFSHIMQLTAYMLLVEENYAAPPYGILKYGNIIYRIDYNEDLKNLLLKKVDEMRKALKTGEVHRNHNRRGKCLHCARRENCPERLA